MRRMWSCIALTVAVAACGGDTKPGAKGISTPADFVVAQTKAECQFSVRCGFISASSEKQCEMDADTDAKNFPKVYTTAEAVMNKRLSFDAKAAQACVDAWSKTGCNVNAQFKQSDVCSLAFKGTVAIGGTCLGASECVDGSFCDQGQNGDGCMGTCKAYAATGAPCDSAKNILCGNTDHCDAMKKTCVARGAIGASCTAGSGCLRGSYCKAGMCAGPGVAGDPCNQFLFGNDDCSDELICDGDVPVCAVRGAAGADCDSYTFCQDGLDCVGLSFDSKGKVTKGKCGPWIDAGKPCDPTIQARAGDTGCPYDMLCGASSTCEAAGMSGGDCSMTGTNGICRNYLYCDPNSVCSPQIPLGQACTPDKSMQSDPCHDGSCDPMLLVCAAGCM